MTYKITVMAVCTLAGFFIGGWITALCVAATYLIADNIAVYN